MLNRYLKAFTLVEMLVALAVSSIIIIASYASYDLVATQYRKNLDIADMHTSGRAIMRIIERDIRMAGFEYRDKDAKVTYGTIKAPIDRYDSRNKCKRDNDPKKVCDEVTVIYDYFDEESKKAERIRIKYWAETHTSNKGSRYRLYKQKDILGQNKKMLAKPILGIKEVMADYIEDFQIVYANESLGSGSSYLKIDKNGKELINSAKKWSCVKEDRSGLIWEANFLRGKYRWPDPGNKIIKGWSVLLDNNNNNNLCGKTNWRLPTIDELKSLIVKGNGVPLINRSFFPKTKDGKYWSSSPASGNKQYAAYQDFKYGNIGGNLKYDHNYIRLVSSGLINIGNLININLTLRTKNQYGKDRQFKKKDYHPGNYKLDKTDKYKRDTFSSTVLVRNLAL